jgi:hypothetical protein
MAEPGGREHAGRRFEGEVGMAPPVGRRPVWWCWRRAPSSRAAAALPNVAWVTGAPLGPSPPLRDGHRGGVATSLSCRRSPGRRADPWVSRKLVAGWGACQLPRGPRGPVCLSGCASGVRSRGPQGAAGREVWAGTSDLRHGGAPSIPPGTRRFMLRCLNGRRRMGPTEARGLPARVWGVESPLRHHRILGWSADPRHGFLSPPRRRRCAAAAPRTSGAPQGVPRRRPAGGRDQR